jgi:hypothetical protein
VAIDDPRMRLLVHTPHHGEADAARTRSILEREPDEATLAYALSLGMAPERAATPRTAETPTADRHSQPQCQHVPRQLGSRSGGVGASA